ncbi:sigma-54-dependent transcriptional regulator [Noviherbaspirillum denitrificans]|uniref:Fis family transcriptional regulator n=1 Tax=Noviherbaspirillum denitrificans TaxID=1968433 RepID=A0A254TGW8_9BURK|nr:sigma-54 dependent transcriptional regulator [Noviherbaspirillum denitrificans]OWW18928.1 Fis family transcriptional regulator [Noviherbaspirillum denitrificans]
MTAPRILVVDDEADLRELLDITLVKMGLDVDCAESLTAARACLAQSEYALVLTDMRLPDGMGIELVREVAASCRNTPIAVITAFGSADNAVAALKAGAFDYLSKPVGLDQLRLMVQSALRMHKTEGAGQASSPAAAASSRLVGQSPVMQDLRSQIVRLARSMAPVAITGESGSGKELAARDIHAHSARADKPFIAVNCGAIPEALMEAEFFGYRKGAFTGASEDRDGFFQAANGGTLMLDEVADLPLQMQVKLLRAIQERRVRKVGATVEEPVDVRVISATHQNLAECVEKGRFRQDLYYRLNVIELRLPPLRERLDDIGLLSDILLERLAPPGSKAVLSPEALDALKSYAFPGNVRELENILERALAFANDGVIAVADLALKASAAPVEAMPAPVPQPIPEEIRVAVPVEPAPVERQPAPAPVIPEGELPQSLPDYLDDVEREIIRRALARTHFNRTQAAELLGISFRQLRYRMQRLDIHEPDT